VKQNAGFGRAFACEPERFLLVPIENYLASARLILVFSFSAMKEVNLDTSMWNQEIATQNFGWSLLTWLIQSGIRKENYMRFGSIF
jgi:hypothetical protein